MDAAPETVTCTRCGAVVKKHLSVYGEGGALLCASCSGNDEVAAAESKAANAVFASAIGGVFLASIGWCFNPCFVFTVLGLLTGSGALTQLLRVPEYKRVLGWRWGVGLAASGLAVLLSVLGLLFGLLGVGAMLAGGH